ncbi:MAG: hypothetical protein Q8R48_02955 [Candidatus Omnitrophota bacterium]|nr:hypothetical protein [Candidatus Omnitrophota bacterium]
MRPIFGKLLIAATVLYVIGITFLLSDVYYRLGDVEHALVHIKQGDTCQHK